MATTLVWLRRDLRLDDQPALADAAARGAVVPVFVWSPEEEGASAPGAASRWWLHRSLESLDAALRKRGLRLILRRGPAARTLLELARQTGADAAAWSRVWEPALESQQSRVRQALEAEGVACREQAANLLFEPPSVRSQDGRPYRVFTPFWNRCSLLPAPAKPIGAPRSLNGPGGWPRSLSLGGLRLLPEHSRRRKLEEAFIPGESAARETLKAFVRESLKDYRKARDIPSWQGTSLLSPRLHFGELSVRRVWSLAASGPQGPETKGGFLIELGWREFAAHVLHHFPRTVEGPLDVRFAGFPWRRDPEEPRMSIQAKPTATQCLQTEPSSPNGQVQSKSSPFFASAMRTS